MKMLFSLIIFFFFFFLQMIGSNWITKLLITLFHIPQFVMVIVDFVITFYISLSILIFSLTTITAYQTYIQSYLTVFNVSLIVSVVIGIISVIIMMKQNKNKNNRIELIIEYIYYELTLVPISLEVRRMLKNDKRSVTYQTDKRAIKFDELLERIGNMKKQFGDDIKKFIQNNKSVIYNKLEGDIRFKVFEKDIEKEGDEGEEKVGSFTMVYIFNILTFYFIDGQNQQRFRKTDIFL